MPAEWCVVRAHENPVLTTRLSEHQDQPPIISAILFLPRSNRSRSEASRKGLSISPRPDYPPQFNCVVVLPKDFFRRADETVLFTPLCKWHVSRTSTPNQPNLRSWSMDTPSGCPIQRTVQRFNAWSKSSIAEWLQKTDAPIPLRRKQ